MLSGGICNDKKKHSKHVRKLWSNFSKTGECVGIRCDNCPFHEEGVCYDMECKVSNEYKIEMLNKEMK